MFQLERAWFDGSQWPKLLTPLEWLFCALSRRKRAKDQQHQWQPDVPLIVVGNISVGGTGKTPFTLALIKLLRDKGYTPGVVSRGYKAKPPIYPYFVTADGDAALCGDEPLMLVQRSGVPLVIDPDRVSACKALLESTSCDIIISDDGLQHYRMGRTIEIAVVDGQRGLGNGHCLPVGPLREAPQRLSQVDIVVINGEGAFHYSGAYTMMLQPQALLPLRDAEPLPLGDLFGKTVHAVAGIGHPERFFSTLASLGVKVIEHRFADHHQFVAGDITFGDGLPVIMTEKDAVKCRGVNTTSSVYFLPVEAILPAALDEKLIALIEQRTSRVDKNG